MGPKDRKTSVRVIGLTGNIASGKSTVARFLEELGLPVIDADQVSREVTRPGSPALQAIVTALGPSTLATDGTLDRKAVRELVFGAPELRKALEAILHPAIQARTQQLLADYFRAGRTTVIYEASLLVEAGRAADMDGLLVVTASPKVRTQRLMARDPSLDAKTAQGILSAQLSDKDKAAAATWVIENDGTVDELKAKVRAWAAAVNALNG